MPERIQRRRARGWRLPEGAVYVGRPTRWGNPFRIGSLVMDPGPYGGPASPYTGVLRPGTYTWTWMGGPYEYVIRPVRDAADATTLFRAHVRYHTDWWPPEAIRRELGGRDLACWCPLPTPGEPDHCHAAVLISLANEVPADV